jgi:transcriptional regulator GlxA family with amidase domain
MSELKALKVDSNAAYSVGFLLLENFTLMSLASAMEPIRMANHLSGKKLYDWKIIGAAAEPITSSGGVSLVPDVTSISAREFDLVLVVGGVNVKENTTVEVVRWLKSQSGKVEMIGGLCTGAYALAKAGLLDGYSASAHWECLAALQEEYPLVYCNNHLFTFDRNRVTCTGGDVPLHMMIHLVASQRGQAIANGIIDMFVCDRVRDSYEPQRLRMEGQLFANHPKLANAVQLMESNIEEPIELGEIASYSSISRRQLERLFLTNLGVTPSRFYLKLRLERAKQLLTQTSCSVVEISTMCGFVSAPHFSRSYRKHMGHSPKGERENRNGIGAGIVLTEESVGLMPSRSESALEKARKETSFGRLSEQ